MPVTETLGGLGSWELQLKGTTPDYVVAQLGFFGHVVVVDGHLPVGYVESAGNALLAGARYVGVCRAQDHPDAYVRGGAGGLFWLGDEDGKGYVFESTVTLTNATLAQVVTALKPPTVTTGTVFAQADPAVRYTGNHIFQTPREALAVALAPFGAEVRVNPDFSIDVGTPSQLYNTAAPDKIIKRRAEGADVNLAALGGNVDVQGTAVDYSSRIVLLGQTLGTGGAPDTQFATGSINAPSVPWKDPQGNTAKFTRLISESGQTTGSVAARAQLQLNRFNRATSSVKVTAEEFEVQGTFAAGDAVYVYDPDSGIVNPAIEVFFRGEKLNPDIVRVTQRTWPVVDGMTVAWRTDTGVWIDLTPWVVWESAGTHELVVGDLPKTLFKQGTPNGAVQDRVDAGRGIPDSTRTPKAPTGLALTTSSTPNASGWDSAVIAATWNPVTQYTDSTTVALSHYEVQYRPQFRSPLWTASFITDALAADLPVTAALGYDVQVRAVSTGGVPSAWSSPASIVSAADSTGPATPSDPVVTQYLGLLRIYWNGLNSVGGAMPSDFNRVDVHVGTSSGFTASAATLVSSLSAPGYAHAQAPYGSTRYVRFIAYDHNGNASASSAVISGATAQAADGDIAALSVGKLTAGIMTADVTISGRFATALTGARREVNSVGFQAFDASNNLLVNIDGVNNLLTGIFKTALTGRRLEIGAAGATGELNFYAPDGTLAQLHAYTESTGVEAVQLGIPISGATDALWNKLHINSDEWLQLRSKNVDLSYLNGGFFAVRQKADRGSGSSVTRVQLDNGGFTYRDAANVARVGLTSDTLTVWDGSAIGRLQIGPTAVTMWDSSSRSRFSFGTGSTSFGFGTNASFAELWPAPVSTGTAYLKLVTPLQTGGGLYAITLLGNMDSPGINLRAEFRDSNASGYIPVYASAFTPVSDRATKTGIVDFDGADSMAVLNVLRPRRFRRKKSADGKDIRVAEPISETGFVTDEMPPALVVGDPASGVTGIDLMGLVTRLVVAAQQFDDRLGRLEEAA